MTPNRRKIHRGVGIFLLALAGCGPTKPPSMGLEEAAQALDGARNAGAPTYAPMELRRAEDHLSQARARAAKRDYDAAASLAQEAQADSELAAVKARLGKARDKVDARTHENANLRQQAASGINPADAPGGQP
jgi:predicted S18 family serine protease